jgi:hypothetical protein
MMISFPPIRAFVRYGMMNFDRANDLSSVEPENTRGIAGEITDLVFDSQSDRSRTAMTRLHL